MTIGGETTLCLVILKIDHGVPHKFGLLWNLRWSSPAIQVGICPAGFGGSSRQGGVSASAPTQVWSVDDTVEGDDHLDGYIDGEPGGLRVYIYMCVCICIIRNINI